MMRVTALRLFSLSVLVVSGFGMVGFGVGPGGQDMVVTEGMRERLEMEGLSFEVVERPVAPRVIAVRVRHAMCPLCMELEPRMDRVIRHANREGVLMVTIDLSTEGSRAQSAFLAGTLGIEGVWPADLVSMGRIVFLDGETREELGSVQTFSAKAVIRGMDLALESLSLDELP